MMDATWDEVGVPHLPLQISDQPHLEFSEALATTLTYTRETALNGSENGFSVILHQVLKGAGDVKWFIYSVSIVHSHGGLHALLFPATPPITPG